MKSAILFLAGSLLLFGCGETEDDVDLKTSSYALENPLTTVTILDDCDGGGTYEVTATVDTVEVPAKVEASAAFTYTACVTNKYGTIDGTLSYNKLLTEPSPGQVDTAISYNSALTYLGTHVGSCITSFALADLSNDAFDKVSIAESCQHPGLKLLKSLEKCDMKDSKPDKKGKNKCELKF